MHLSKENRNKIGLMIFGLTLFPAIVHGMKDLFVDFSGTIFGFYSWFYRSLLDMAKDGMIAWGIACGPYMVYEIVLLVRSFSSRSSDRDIDELESSATDER